MGRATCYIFVQDLQFFAQNIFVRDLHIFGMNQLQFSFLFLQDSIFQIFVPKIK